MSGTPSINLSGEEVVLLAERALFWQKQATIFIADTHLGNTERFFATEQIPVEGGGTTQEILTRLSQVLNAYKPERLVILGDLIHARGGRSDAMLTLVDDWRADYQSLDVLLIRGNHDAVVGDPPSAWRFTCVDEPYHEPPFMLCHYPRPIEKGYVLAGHLHPAVRPTGRGLLWRKRPAFVFRKNVCVMPAFGEALRLATLLPRRDEQVFYVVDDQVCPYTI